MARRKSNKTKLTWPQSAARYAWASFIVAIIVPTCLTCAMKPTSSSGTRTEADYLAMMAPGIVALLLAVSGIGAGVVSLFAMKKYGTKRILAPAVTGIVLHVLLIVLMIASVGAARRVAEKIKQNQQQQESGQDSANP